MSEKTKGLFVLGLDGMDFHLIREWSKEWDLSNFAHFFEEGTHGILECKTRPFTPISWTSILTGVGPSDHGVNDFILNGKMQASPPEGTPSEVLGSKAPHVWRIAEKQGRKVAAMHLTHIGPVMNYPRGIIERKFEPPTLPEDEKRKRKWENWLNVANQAVNYVNENAPDFAFLMYRGSDAVFHQLDRIERGEIEDYPIKEEIGIFDLILGKLLDLEDYLIMVISDHGRPEGGAHNKNGTFLCEDFIKGRQDLNTYHIAPLILWFLDCEIPNYMRAKEEINQLYSRYRLQELGYNI